MAVTPSGNAARLDTLPALALHRITLFCSRKTLRNLRLTCHTISNEATRTLFSVCCIWPSEESAKRFELIRENPELARWVRVLCLKTWEENHERHSGKRDEISAGSKRAFLAGAKLPGLNGIEVIFSDICAFKQEGREYQGDPPQPTSFRQDVLRLVLDLYDSIPQRAQIRSLSLQGLQDVNDKDIVDSLSFKSLISKLKSLELHIATEDWDSNKDSNVWFPELHEFTAQLPAIWLLPSAATLSRLTLFANDTELGFFPRLDLRELEFPRLRHLAFGNIVFSHDWQFDWIIKHGSTLEELCLEECSIIYARYSDTKLDEEDYLNVNAFLTSRYGFDLGDDVDTVEEPYRYVSFERRWHHFFDRLALEMPRMCDFRFGSSHVIGRIISNGEHTVYPGCSLLPRHLNQDRYQAVNCGQHDSEIYNLRLESIPEDVRHQFEPPECQSEDEAAFTRLLNQLHLPMYEISWEDAHTDPDVYDKVPRFD